MDIATFSIQNSLANVNYQANILLTKKAMDQAEATGVQLLDMLNTTTPAQKVIGGPRLDITV